MKRAILLAVILMLAACGGAEGPLQAPRDPLEVAIEWGEMRGWVWRACCDPGSVLRDLCSVDLTDGLQPEPWRRENLWCSDWRCERAEYEPNCVATIYGR